MSEYQKTEDTAGKEHCHSEGCCCDGHGHEHLHEQGHHDHGSIEISTHESSVIASVKMDLGREKHYAAVLLKSFMTAVAEEAEAAGGMVGHIKFFLKESIGEVYSMTEPKDCIRTRSVPLPEYSAEGVCIIIGIEPYVLESIVKLHYPDVR